MPMPKERLGPAMILLGIEFKQLERATHHMSQHHAASGIGAELVRRLVHQPAAASGAWNGDGVDVPRQLCLLLHTRSSASALRALAAEVRACGASAEVVLGDLASPDVPSRLVAEAVVRF